MAENKIETLWKAAWEGQKDAENELFKHLSARFHFFAFHRICDGEDRKEVVQTALTVIFSEYKKIEFTRSFSAWAYRVLDNQVLSYIQTRKRQAGRNEELPESDYLPDLAGLGDKPGLKRQILECLRKIGKRNVIYIRTLNFHYQGYSTDEICRKLEITRANFYSVLSRARSMLQACLEKGGKYDG